MPLNELAHVFDGPQGSMVGVLSCPDAPATTALLIIVGGPQYRVGSHRQFVHLARSATAAGYATLRFDYQGMGDSDGEMAGFENVDADVGAAIDFLFQQLPGLKQVALWGLCDGASAALLYCQRRRDPRVFGLCLVNPWVRSTQTLARTHVKHYYLQRLKEPAFWRKLLSGGVAWQAARSLLSNLRAARRPASAAHQQLTYQARMARAWIELTGPMLLVLSGNDYTAKEFMDTVTTDTHWRGALDRIGLTRHTLADADHTFSVMADQRELEAITCGWLAAHAPQQGGIQPQLKI